MEQEQEQVKQPERDIPEGYEDQNLAEASHITLAGADDTMDMQLDIDQGRCQIQQHHNCCTE